MAISILLFSMVFSIISPAQIGLPVWVSEQIFSLSNGELLTRLTYGGMCLLVLLSGAVLFYIELRPLFISERRFLISKDDLGKVEITESCIGKFVDYEAKRFKEISDATSQITKKKAGLQIKSDVFVSPESNIPDLGQNVRARLKERLETNLGLLISKISVTAKINQKTTPSGRLLK